MNSNDPNLGNDSGGELITDLTGKRISGNQGTYILDRHIAQGARSNLYRAIWTENQVYVCAKVLTFQMSKRDIEQMQREEMALSRLSHPNIIKIYDAIAIGGFHCTIMDYYPEGSLANRLRGGTISLTETGSIIAQIASAVDYAHSNGIIHQDIKPANILMHQGRAVLSDYGIARVVGEQLQTRSGGFAGTPAYMSPEQVEGTLVGAASDQYSLAVVAYELLSGRVPHQGDSAMATLQSKLNDPIPSLGLLNRDIPYQVEKVVLKALAKSPSKRYRSASEFALALNEAIRSPVAVRRPMVRQKNFRDLLPDLNAKQGLVLIFLISFLGSLLGTILALFIRGF